MNREISAWFCLSKPLSTYWFVLHFIVGIKQGIRCTAFVNSLDDYFDHINIPMYEEEGN